MSESGLNVDFLDLLTELARGQAEHVVVGAHALGVHGVPRATGDLDVLVRPTTENARRVYAALRRFGAPVERHGLNPEDLARPGVVYQMGLPPRRIDILTSISGRSFEEVWTRRVELEVGGLTIPFIGRADLLVNKRASGRPKDLLDLELLREVEEE